MTTNATVVVIGGGLSGLTAAESLVMKHGIDSVVVLEEKDRVGGRTFSMPVGGKGAVFDLGGQWTGPHQKAVLALAKRLDVHLHEQFSKGTKVMDYGGVIGTYAADIPSMSIPNLIDVQVLMWRVQAVIDSIPLDDPMGANHAAYYDSITAETYVNSLAYTEGAKTLFKTAIQAVFGVEPRDMSALFMLWYARQSDTFKNLIEINNANQNYTFVGGSQQLSLKLADIITASNKGIIKLSEKVVKIDWNNNNNGNVTIHTASGNTYQSTYVVLAMPPALCQKITFSPLLPTDRQQLHARSLMGSIAKVLVLYDRPYWREKGFSGEVICDCSLPNSPTFNVFDDTLPIMDAQGKETSETQPALVCFINAETNRKWSMASEEEVKAGVVNQLVRWYGHEMATPTCVHMYNWTNDATMQGGPIGVMPPGVLSSCHLALRKSIGPIFFAGTEAATYGQGFLDGAVVAGEKCANDIAASLKKSKL